MKKVLHTDEFLHGGDYNPEQWLKTPDVINQDFALFKQADINTVTVGIFSWAKLEPSEGKYNFEWLDDIFDRMEEMNGHVILATPSGARPAWLAQKYPEVLRVDEYGRRHRFGGRHNHCLTSPIYRQKVSEINKKLAGHFGKRKSLVCWHISNEYSGSCYCDLCQEKFRTWLKEKYGNLDNLNHAWWNTFWSHTFTDWSQVTPPGPLSETGSKGMNLDWNRFTTDRTISFIENEIKPLKEITPDIPVTTNMMAGHPNLEPFGGLDYQKIAKHLDIISWDSYPAWGNDRQTTAQLGRNVALIHDFFRSLKHQNFMIMENTPSRVNWQEIDRAKRPGVHELASLQDIAHGAQSVLYFQLRASRGSAEMFHGAVIEHRHPDKTRVFKDVTKVGQDLNKIKEVINTHYKDAKVAIVYDQDNMWALNDAESYDRENKKYWQTIQDHYDYFYKHDIPVDVIGVDDDLSQYKLIIDPMHFLMSKDYMDKLRSYVENGGHVVGTYISGVVDERVLAYMNEWSKQLQDIYGIEPVETDVLYPGQDNEIDFDGGIVHAYDYCEILENHDATALSTYRSDFYKDTPVMTKHNLGKGTGYYLAARTSTAVLNTYYEKLCKELDLNVKYPIKKHVGPISIQVRENNDYIYYFVQNYNHHPHHVRLSEPLYEMLSQKKEKGKIELNGYETKVYRQEK